MEHPPQSRFSWALGFSLVFFALFFLYIRLAIDTRLFYEMHPRFPVFYTGWTFFKALTTRYGGPLEYVSGFLAQSYYSAWLGALVVTLVTGLICLATDALLRAMGGSGVGLAALIPAVILLVAHNHFFNQLTLIVVILAALACVLLYVRVPLKGDLSRAAFFVVLSLLLYFAAGGAYLLFAALAGIYELLARQRRLLALVAFLSMEAVPYLVGTYVLEVSLTDSYMYSLPFHPHSSQLGAQAVLSIYVLLPTLAFIVGLRRTIATRREARAAESGAQEAPEATAKRGRSQRLRRIWPHPAVGWLLFLVAAASATLFTYHHREMAWLRIDYCAKRGMWEAVLRTARKLPLDEHNLLVTQHVNEALYHTGRLPYEMFRYPQRRDGLLFDMELSKSVEDSNRKIKAVRDAYFQIGDLDLRLGLVNEAEHEAHEALGVHGEHGTILYRLALINIVKEQPQAARAFLTALRRHLIYGRQAESLLERLEADPKLSTDPQVQQIRSVMLRRDEAILDPTGERGYLALLERNRRNRMAFEYLMAFYLLTRQLDKFAENLPRLRDFDYPDLPRHYQEAVLLYERNTSKRADRCGYEISGEVLQEFADFSRELQLGPGGADVPAPLALIVPKYGNTYFHYYLTELSGVGER